MASNQEHNDSKMEIDIVKPVKRAREDIDSLPSTTSITDDIVPSAKKARADEEIALDEENQNSVNTTEDSSKESKKIKKEFIVIDK